MNARDGANEPGHASTFAATLLQLAAEVERDERLVKERIEEAIAAGEFGRASRLARLWKTHPAGEVLRLDAGGEVD